MDIQEHCMKEVHNFGNTVYQNICYNSPSVVGWGSLDWFWIIFAGVCLVLASYIAYKIIKL